MRFADIKIGTKLHSSFIIIILIFLMTTFYQLFGINNMSGLQDESTKSANESLDMYEVMNRFDYIYTEISDAIINRDISKTRNYLEHLREEAQMDIDNVYKIADTADNIYLAKEFSKEYINYIDVFEKELFPILEKGMSLESRLKDVLEIKDISLRIIELYTVMEDAIINRDLTMSGKVFENKKSQAQNDIKRIIELSVTDTEKAAA